jgi:hypothetical protein
MARALVSRAGVWTLVSLIPIVALFAAACGSSEKKHVAVRSVRGPGFRFSVPQTWSVRRTATSASARSPGDTSQPTVSANVFRLAKRYAPARFARATAELDAVAAQLARKAGGTITESATTTVAGRRIRAYRFTARSVSGRHYEDRVGFVLVGRREIQLLCQAPAGAGDPDGACRLLFASFRLTG